MDAIRPLTRRTWVYLAWLLVAEAIVLLVTAFGRIIPSQVGGPVTVAIIITYFILFFSYEPVRPIKSDTP